MERQCKENCKEQWKRVFESERKSFQGENVFTWGMWKNVGCEYFDSLNVYNCKCLHVENMQQFILLSFCVLNVGYNNIKRKKTIFEVRIARDHFPIRPTSWWFAFYKVLVGTLLYYSSRNVVVRQHKFMLFSHYLHFFFTNVCYPTFIYCLLLNII